MKTIKTLNEAIAALALATVAAAAWSCRDSDDKGPADQLCENVVTFTGNGDGQAWFEYQTLDDSPVIKLSVRGSLDIEKVGIGTRLLMRYALPPGVNPAEGGLIERYSLQRVLADTVTLADKAPADPGQLYLTTIQRSGEYLDIRAQMPYASGRSISLIADTLHTAADGITEAYITAVNPSADSAYMAAATASIWLGPLWRRPGLKGVRVHINNINNPYRDSFTFLRKQ